MGVSTNCLNRNCKLANVKKGKGADILGGKVDQKLSHINKTVLVLERDETFTPSVLLCILGVAIIPLTITWRVHVGLLHNKAKMYNGPVPSFQFMTEVVTQSE